MAKIKATLPEEFMQRITLLGNKADEIMGRVVQAGGEVVEAKVRSNLQSVIGKGLKEESRTTGELLSSLGTSPPDVDHNGDHNVHVGFAEPRKQQNDAKGKRSYYVRTNAMIANVIEYGKHGQPAKPFLKPAKSASKKPCEEAMKAALEKELEQI